jgi:hypothetical protein
MKKDMVNIYIKRMVTNAFKAGFMSGANALLDGYQQFEGQKEARKKILELFKQRRESEAELLVQELEMVDKVVEQEKQKGKVVN